MNNMGLSGAFSKDDSHNLPKAGPNALMSSFAGLTFAPRAQSTGGVRAINEKFTCVYTTEHMCKFFVGYSDEMSSLICEQALSTFMPYLSPFCL
jgi:hypothetical protein